MATTNNQNVNIKLVVDNTNLKAGLASAQASLSKFGAVGTSSFSSINKSMTGVEKQVQAASKSFNGLGLAVAGATVIAGIMALGAAVGYVYKEAGDAALAQRQLNASLIATEHAAGLSAEQISTMATELQGISGIDDDVIKSMQGVLLTFKNIKGDTFKDASLQVMNLSAKMGIDLNHAAVQVGKALQDPIKGVTALRRVGVMLDADQTKQIATYMKTGEVAKAQGIILQELAGEFGGSAEAGKTAMMAYETSARNLAETMGTTVKPAIDSVLYSLSKFADSINVMLQVEQVTGNLARTFTALATLLTTGAVAVGFVITVLHWELIIAKIKDAIAMLNAYRIAIVFSMMVNPITLAALAIAGLIGAIVIYNKHHQDSIRVADKVIAGHIQEEAKVKDLLATYDVLSKNKARSTAENEKLIATKAELLKLFPNLNFNLVKEGDLHKAIEAAMYSRQKMELQLTRQVALQSKERAAAYIKEAEAFTKLFGQWNFISMWKQGQAGQKKNDIAVYEEQVKKTDEALKNLEKTHKAFTTGTSGMGGYKPTPYTTSGGTGGSTKTKVEDTAKKEIDAYKSTWDKKLAIDDQNQKLQIALAGDNAIKKADLELSSERKKSDMIKQELIKLGVSKTAIESTAQDRLYSFDLTKVKKTDVEKIKYLTTHLNNCKIETLNYLEAMKQAELTKFNETQATKKQILDLKLNEQLTAFKRSTALSKALGINTEIETNRLKGEMQKQQMADAQAALIQQGVDRQLVEQTATMGTAAFERSTYFQTLTQEKQQKLIQLAELANAQRETQAELASEALTTMQTSFQGIQSAGSQLYDGLTNSSENWGKRMSNICGGIINMLIQAVNLMTALRTLKAAGGILSLFGGGGSALAGGVGNIGGLMGFASGGIIPGSYSKATPVMAHGSEMVLNPSQQARLFAQANGTAGGRTSDSSGNGASQNGGQPIIVINNNISSLEPQTAAKLVKDQMPFIESTIMESMNTKSSWRGTIKKATS